MNKLLTLINIDLKRSSKFYLIYTLGFSFLTLFISILQTSTFKNHLYMSENTIEYMTKSYGGVTYGNAILYNNKYIYLFIIIGMLGLLMYSCYIWIKEYTQANKSIYTLIIIPENKFIIYLSKMIATITMIYGYITAQIIGIFIGKSIFSIYFKNSNLIKTSLVEDIINGSPFNLGMGGIPVKIIPTNINDFFMYYVVVLILLISLIFTMCLIGLSLRGNLKKSLLSIIVVPWVVYLYIINRFAGGTYYILGNYLSTIYNVDLFINIGTIIVLNVVSYILINKKLYI